MTFSLLRNNALANPQLLFLPDEAMHKRYLKKLWIGREVAGAVTLAELYSKDTSLPVLTSFLSTPSEIDEDASPPTNITLSWNSSGTITSRRITDLHRHANVPLQAGNRAVVARPLTTTVYSLEASNNFGTVSDRITVPVFKDCVINSFTVQYLTNPLSPHGATVRYNFSVTGKPRPSISIDQGVGAVGESPSHGTYDADTGVWSGNISRTYGASGSFTATLTATNVQANGQQGPTVTATVNVIIP